MATENEGARELERILAELAQLTGRPQPEIDSMLGFLIRTAALATRGKSDEFNEWQLHYDPNKRKFWVSIGDAVHFRDSQSPIEALKNYALSWLAVHQNAQPRPDLVQAPEPDPQLRRRGALTGPALN